MPEGDTIHGLQRILAPRVLGRPVVGLIVDRLPRPEARGARADLCEAVGKHLRLRFAAPGLAPLLLRVHLGMKGSWHSYRPHEPWQRHPSRAGVVLALPERVFVCFDPKEVSLERAGHVLSGTGTGVDHLGPDLLAPKPDLSDILARARAPRHRDLALGDLLLTQPVAAGIGNVYKAETLFLEGLDPWLPASRLDDAALARVYTRAAELLRLNVELGGWRITTYTPGGDAMAARARPKEARYWVYRRRNRPCRRCQTLIRSRLQGAMARMTYWCPRCQES
jgi:endonuclease-8